MAIKGILNPGDHVISTDLEHNSVLRPLYRLESAGAFGPLPLESRLLLGGLGLCWLGIGGYVLWDKKKNSKKS